MFDSSHHNSPEGPGEATGAGSASRTSGNAGAANRTGGSAGPDHRDGDHRDRGHSPGQGTDMPGQGGDHGGAQDAGLGGQGDRGDARDEHGADHGGSGQGVERSGGSGGGHLVFEVLDMLDAGFAQGREVDAAGLNDDDLAVAIRRVHAVAARQAELFTRL
ncbi:hypothetical protein G1H10_08190, partial [Phytoactinopolyspora halotolerans]|nr:hypothetical protein [Phytoactinopolyspora halotolerans]